MGVYINMEMPKDGYIDVRINCNGTASFAIGKNPYFKEVKAIHIPEPHGRLIDEENICDKLRPLIENPYCYNRLQIISETLAHCLQIISDAPTVIQASKEAE